MKYAVFTVLLLALSSSALGLAVPAKPLSVLSDNNMPPPMDPTLAMNARLAGAMGDTWVGVLDRVMTPNEWREAGKTGEPPTFAKHDPRRAYLDARMETNKVRVAQEVEGVLPIEKNLPFDNPPDISPEELEALEAYYFSLTDAEKENIWNAYRWGDLKTEDPALYNFLTFKLLATKPGMDTRDVCDAFIEGEFYLTFIYGGDANTQGASIEVFSYLNLTYMERQRIDGNWSLCHIFLEKQASFLPTHFLVLASCDPNDDSQVFEKIRFGGNFTAFQMLADTNDIFGCDLHQSWGNTFMCLAQDQGEGLLYEWDRNTGFELHSVEGAANGKGCSIMRLTPWPTDSFEERNVTEPLAKPKVDSTLPPEYRVAWIIVPEDDDDYDYDYDYDEDHDTPSKRFVGTVLINAFVAGGNVQTPVEMIEDLETVLDVHFMTQGLFWQRRIYLGVVQFSDALEANSEVNSLVFQYDRSTGMFGTNPPQPIPGVGAVRMQSIHPGGLLPFEWSHVNLMFTLTNQRKFNNVKMVENEDDLQDINNDLDIIYIQLTPIICTVPFEPIGDEENPFCGQYFGQGNTITNCNVQATTSAGANVVASVGMWSNVGGGSCPPGSNPTIMDTIFEDITVMGDMDDDIVGTVAGTCGDGATIENVVAGGTSVESGHARAASVEGYMAGGVVGQVMSGCTVMDVTYRDATVFATAGGCLVGVNEGVITRSRCEGPTMTVTTAEYGGGITGTNSGTVTESYATDETMVQLVFVEGASEKMRAFNSAGGATGLNAGDGLFEDCYSQATVMGGDGNLAYFAGTNGLLFEQGANATGRRANNGFLNRVFGAGMFTVLKTSTNALVTGGLAAVYGSTNGGPDTDITNSVWDKTSQTTSAGSSNSFGRDPGMGAGELGNVATYDPTLGWDFLSVDPIWCIGTDGYPKLAQLQPAECAGPQYDHLRDVTALDLFHQRVKARAPMVRRLLEPTVEVSSTVWCYSHELRAFELCDTLPPGAASTGNLLTYRLPFLELGLVQTNSENDAGNPNVDNKIFRRGIA